MSTGKVKDIDERQMSLVLMVVVVMVMKKMKDYCTEVRIGLRPAKVTGGGDGGDGGDDGEGYYHHHHHQNFPFQAALFGGLAGRQSWTRS